MATEERAAAHHKFGSPRGSHQQLDHGTIRTIQPWGKSVDFMTVERRNPGGGKTREVTCVACGVRVLLEPSKMRLRATHAELGCPACNAVLPVRRSDAYVGLQDDVAWTIASYAETWQPVADPEPKGIGRLLRRRRADKT
jgi:hypothetical protein